MSRANPLSPTALTGSREAVPSVWARVALAFAVAVGTAGTCDAESADVSDAIGPLDADGRRWVEDTLERLSLRELVGQLVIEWIPGGYAAPSSPDFAALERWVVEDGIGGVVPSIGTPHAYVAKLNALQAKAHIPLLVTADFENGGPGMRINGSFALPSMLPQGGGTDLPPTMAFGAIGDEAFAREYGRVTAVEARASGVHLLFAPVLDVNNNPDNPVIASRSFGGAPDLVARLGAAFVRGAREGGAFTTGKHFPGHGDTSVDSHVGLPVIGGDRTRLDSLELVPFAVAVDAGVDAMMTAHVSLPGLLGPGAPPATLAPEVMTDLLRDDLGFSGILFTDALTMRAITDGYGVGEAAVRSLEAGSDVILSPKDVGTAISSVVSAVETGRIPRGRVEQSVRRLLELKARLGLHRDRFVPLDQVDRVVGSGDHLAFADSAATRSMTLVSDRAGIIPMRTDLPVRTVHLRYTRSTWLWTGRAFDAALANRVPEARTIELDERSTEAHYSAAATALAEADRVLVTVYVHPSAGSGVDALPDRFRALVNASARARPTVLVSLRSPYLARALPQVTTHLVAWGDGEASERAAVRALFGEEAISGTLPIAIPPGHQVGDGLVRERVTSRMADAGVEDPLVAAGIVARGSRAAVPGQEAVTADPASVGMSPEALDRIDDLVRAALDDSVASGVSLAIGRRARLVKLGGYGELAYGSGRPATPTSIWDLASVSKVVGTTTAAMILVGEGRLQLDSPVVNHLPWWAGEDVRKEAVTVRQLLLHRTGLPPFRRWFFEMSGVEAYKEAAAAERLESEPGAATVYSDIGVMTLAWVIEEITGQSLDSFLEGRVWQPLGMLDTRYRPPVALRPRIAATEVDTVWRGELVWGRVHDENADAMGGVAGHAGLFSTAVDLSVFASTLLNGGLAPSCVPGRIVGEPCPVERSGERRIVDSQVLAEFTRRHDESASRAHGWDTPSEPSSAGRYFSGRSFGHTGYTGTSIWLDPELDLWVVLLTNRVHPSRDNSRHVPFRRAIHDAAALAVVDREVRERG